MAAAIGLSAGGALRYALLARGRGVCACILQHSRLGCTRYADDHDLQRLVHWDAGRQARYGHRSGGQRREHARLVPVGCPHTFRCCWRGVGNAHRPMDRSDRRPRNDRHALRRPLSTLDFRLSTLDFRLFPLLPPQLRPVHPFVVFHCRICRLDGYQQCLRRCGTCCLCAYDEIVHALLVLYRRFCLCRRGSCRQNHRRAAVSSQFSIHSPPGDPATGGSGVVL